MYRPCFIAFIVCLWTGPGHAAESPGVAATNRYESRAAHDPNGIGKFYLGREIAHVMGHQAADWLERPEREEEEKTQLLVEALKFQPGDQVADIGAGTGYLTRRMAPKILPGGKVYAVEIQQEMLDLITNNMARAGITNVRPTMLEDASWVAPYIESFVIEKLPGVVSGATHSFDQFPTPDKYPELMAGYAREGAWPA